MIKRIAQISVIVGLVTVVAALPVWGQERPMFMDFGSPTVGWIFFDLSKLNDSLSAYGYPTIAHSFLIWGMKRSLVTIFGFPKEWIFGMSYWYGNTTTRQGDKLSRLICNWVGRRIERRFLTVSQASHELAVGEVSVGYLLTFDNGAWDQEGQALPGPPKNFNGWIASLSLGF